MIAFKERLLRLLSRRDAMVFVGLVLVFSAWALANPVSGAPDEPSHVIKAAGTVRGQLMGEAGPDGDTRRYMRVPAGLAQTHALTCYAFDSTHTANCDVGEIPDDGSLVLTVTTADNYNPLYYAIVGLPSLVVDGLPAFYLMRIVSGMICAALLTVAFAAVRRTRSSSWLSFGLLAATTPMVVFLSSSVSPAPVEICASIAIWCLLGVTLQDRNDALFSRRFAAICIVAAFLLQLRSLSPMFLAIALLVSIACVPWHRTRDVLADRRAWPWLALVGLSAVVAVAWTLLSGSNTVPGPPGFPQFTPWYAFQWTVGETSIYFLNILGTFGWVDTHLPLFVHIAFVAIPVLILVVGFAMAKIRVRGVILALGAMCIMVPTILQSLQAAQIGPFWQGRYFLPAVVGLPILAALAVRSASLRRDGGDPIAPRAVAVGSVVWAGSIAVAFAVNLHRYTAGVPAEWFGQNRWSPPLPALLLVAVLGLGLWLFARSLPRTDEPMAVVGDEQLAVLR